MMGFYKTLVALACTTAQLANAQYSGFNYGNQMPGSGAFKQQADFEADFKAAAKLSGASVQFNSARLFTMIQGGTTSDPISAIPAAIATRTSLLLTLWASEGDPRFSNELDALKKTIVQYGPSLDGLVVGISVGSEDLYRISPTGQANNAGLGAEPDKIVDYIRQVRGLIAGTVLSGIPIGHVDTWTEWVDGKNAAVINACDWIGFDAYPYYEVTAPGGNSIERSKALFDAHISATQAVVGGKPIWVTETGFPVTGAVSGQAEPSVANARRFWEEVGCSILGKMNVWWFMLQDAPNSPSFGVIGADGSQLYDLSCTNVDRGTGSASAPTTSPSTPPATTSAGSSSPSSSPPGGNAGGPVAGSSSSSSAGAASTTAPASGGGPGIGSGSSSSRTQTFVYLSPRPTETEKGTGTRADSTITHSTSTNASSASASASTSSGTSAATSAPGNAAPASRATMGSAGAAFAALLGAIIFF